MLEKAIAEAPRRPRIPRKGKRQVRRQPLAETVRMAARACRARVTLARISFADAVDMQGMPLQRIPLQPL